jgi:hypothetical protein
MARDLGSRQRIRIVAPTDGEPIGPNDLALVTLTALEIRRLYASDGRKPRTKERPKDRWNPVEGFLSFRVGGQETPLAWSARVKPEKGKGRRALRYRLEEPSRFARRLLYFGRPRGLLELEMSLLESDQELRASLERVERVTELSAAIARALPGPGAAVAGGLTLLGAILGFARASSRDDLELQLFTSLGDPTPGDEAAPGIVPLRTGEYRIERGRKGGARPDLSIRFGVHRVVPSETGGEVVVLLESLKLDLEDELADDTFVFEAALGSGRRKGSFRFAEVLEGGARKGLENVLAVQSPLLYSGPLDPALPFRFQIATLPDRKRAEALLPALGAGGGFVGGLLEEPEDRRLAQRLGKAAESVGSILLEMLPDTSYALRKEGILGGAEVDDVARELGDRLLLTGVELDGWKRTAVALEGDRGRVEVKLRVGPLPSGRRR